MEQCCNCGKTVDAYKLDQKTDGFRELAYPHFNVCQRCLHVVEEGCTICEHTVFVPRNRTNEDSPDICPACRNDIIEATGNDPGWTVPNNHAPTYPQ